MDNSQGVVGGDGCELMLQKQEWAKDTFLRPSPIKRSQFTSLVDLFLGCRTQGVLKCKLVVEDDFGWHLPPMGSNSDQSNTRGKLTYIRGLDVSFLKEDWHAPQWMALTNLK
ncbi:hypothetical protein ABZP36_020835 [Zizania latifolia]